MAIQPKIFLETIVESASQAVIVCDENDNILFVNNTAARLFGYSKNELTGKSQNILLPERFREPFRLFSQKYFDNGAHPINLQGLDIYARLKNGKELPVEISVSYFEHDETRYKISFISDISRRKEIENALRESESRYRRLFEDDLTGNFIVDGHGNILMCNLSFAKLFGFPNPETAQYRDFFERFPTEEAREEFLGELRRRKKLPLYEISLLRIDGKSIYVLANILGQYNDRGELQTLKGYLLDITQRKEMEAQFLQAQKMESLGILAGSMAHDFSNFVSIIEGYVEIIMMQMPEADPLRKFVEKIRNTNKQAGLLIKQIQAFSRRQEIQPQKMEPNQAILNIEEMLDRLIGKKIRFVSRLSPQLGKIKVDPVQLEQAIMNLAVNARDAMPDGGDLTIRTYQVTLSEDALLHSNAAPGDYVCIEVADTGIGMDEETKSRIFEPFFTTKPRGKGTGLGLSTVYGIVKQNHGHIDVETKPGVGTTFKLYFPMIT